MVPVSWMRVAITAYAHAPAGRCAGGRDPTKHDNFGVLCWFGCGWLDAVGDPRDTPCSCHLLPALQNGYAHSCPAGKRRWIFVTRAKMPARGGQILAQVQEETSKVYRPMDSMCCARRPSGLAAEASGVPRMPARARRGCWERAGGCCATLMLSYMKATACAH